MLFFVQWPSEINIVKLLFVHQNFPGQYRYLAPRLALDPANTVIALGDRRNIPDPAANRTRVRILPYDSPQGAAPGTHHYIRNLEAAVRRGQQAVRAALHLKEQGFYPDVVCSHPGWGDTLFYKDVFPEAKHLSFFEFYYRAQGSDVGFDPEYPASFDDTFRLRVKNSVNLLTLEAADWGVTPTRWQWQQFPPEYRDKISIIHDGVDTERIAPDPAATVILPTGQVLDQKAEVITYVARNLEPYRGFHRFMRALPEILRRRPAAQVLIVGGDEVSYGRRPAQGTYREALWAEVGPGLPSERVHFLGRLPFADYLRVLQISSVYVYLTYPFVLSWSMLEAMACGCLLVGSRTPPVEEVIRHGENGLLVDFFDIQAIAATVCDALGRQDERQPLREAARRDIMAHYDLNTVCLPRHQQLIADLAAGRCLPGNRL